ncbi:MAG: macro domain-containing protein [Promethearchaeota archaeon]
MPYKLQRELKLVKINNSELELALGDITELEVDAIVNAANKNLILGGGVAGAIRKRGGPSIQEECNKIGGTYVGGAVITGAGNLPAKHVIHAVGPVMGEGNEDEKLKNATENTLKLADDQKLESLAFPAISTGIFQFPIDRCAKIMLNSTISHLKTETGLKRVIFCLYDRDALEVFKAELKKIQT